jgi:hypothetical protein
LQSDFLILFVNLTSFFFLVNGIISSYLKSLQSNPRGKHSKALFAVGLGLGLDGKEESSVYIFVVGLSLVL